jgi:hypothetical protein
MTKLPNGYGELREQIAGLDHRAGSGPAPEFTVGRASDKPLVIKCG